MAKDNSQIAAFYKELAQEIQKLDGTEKGRNAFIQWLYKEKNKLREISRLLSNPIAYKSLPSYQNLPKSKETRQEMRDNSNEGYLFDIELTSNQLTDLALIIIHTNNALGFIGPKDPNATFLQDLLFVLQRLKDTSRKKSEQQDTALLIKVKNEVGDNEEILKRLEIRLQKDIGQAGDDEALLGEFEQIVSAELLTELQERLQYEVMLLSLIEMHNNEECIELQRRYGAAKLKDDDSLPPELISFMENFPQKEPNHIHPNKKARKSINDQSLSSRKRKNFIRAMFLVNLLLITTVFAITVVLAATGVLTPLSFITAGFGSLWFASHPVAAALMQGAAAAFIASSPVILFVITNSLKEVFSGRKYKNNDEEKKGEHSRDINTSHDDLSPKKEKYREIDFSLTQRTRSSSFENFSESPKNKETPGCFSCFSFIFDAAFRSRTHDTSSSTNLSAKNLPLSPSSPSLRNNSDSGE